MISRTGACACSRWRGSKGGDKRPMNQHRSCCAQTQSSQRSCRLLCSCHLLPPVPPTPCRPPALSRVGVGMGKPSVPLGLFEGAHTGAGTWLSQASSAARRGPLGTGSIAGISSATSEPKCLLQLRGHFKACVPLICCAWSAVTPQAARYLQAFPSSAQYFCHCSPFFLQEGGQGTWLSPGHRCCFIRPHDSNRLLLAIPRHRNPREASPCNTEVSGAAAPGRLRDHGPGVRGLEGIGKVLCRQLLCHK